MGAFSLIVVINLLNRFVMRLRNFARLRRRVTQPLYFYGNPQWRVFLPKHKITLLNPAHFDQPKLPRNYVFFEVEMNMTEWELMDYLKNLYKIPVADISMKVSPPLIGKDHRDLTYIKKPECRIARVLLEHGYYFEFPKIFEKQEPEKNFMMSSTDDQQEVATKDTFRKEMLKIALKETDAEKMANMKTQDEKHELMKTKKKPWQRLPGKTADKWM